MYTDLAYLGKPHQDIVDNERPLLVTAAGHYLVHTEWRVPTHRSLGRGDYQLLYVASGVLHLYTGKNEHIIPKGNMLLFRPGDPQIYNLFAKDKPETYWVHFTGSEVAKILEHCSIPRDENVYYIGTSPDYQWLFGQMIRELQLKRHGYEELLCLELKQLLLIINRYLDEGGKVGSEILDEIERAIHYFKENYNKQIVIEQYAVSRHMTPAWFIQKFKRITKYTPMQYIISLRINNAMNLLDSTSYGISQVAATVGYDNPLYFSRLFHKYTGMSPTEYKKRTDAQ